MKLNLTVILGVLVILTLAFSASAETVKVNYWANTSTLTTHLLISNNIKPYIAYKNDKGGNCFASFPDYDAVAMCNTPWFDTYCAWPWSIMDSRCILEDAEQYAQYNDFDQWVDVVLHYGTCPDAFVEKSWYYTGMICLGTTLHLDTKMAVWTELNWTYNPSPADLRTLCGHSYANHEMWDPTLCNLTWNDAVGLGTYGYGYIHNLGRDHFVGRYNDAVDGMVWTCFSCPETLESNTNLAYLNCHWPKDDIVVFGYIVDDSNGYAMNVEFSDTPDINEDGNCDRCMNSPFPAAGSFGGLQIAPWDNNYYYGDSGLEWDRNGDAEFDRDPRVIYGGEEWGK